MAVWILADTHLSHDGSKAMDIFGEAWENHQERLARNWQERVQADDAVIIAGDISWALSLEDALIDLAFLHELPGRRKILLRGNHDYWWSTKGKVTAAMSARGLDSLQLFQNEALLLPEAEKEELLMLGTRGWQLPGDEGFSENDAKILRRELIRLDLSLRAAAQTEKKTDGNIRRIAVMHYPPLGREGEASAFTEMLEKAGVTDCYYGHVHGFAGRSAFRGSRGGICYHCISGDQIAFVPQRVDRD